MKFLNELNEQRLQKLTRLKKRTLNLANTDGPYIRLSQAAEHINLAIMEVEADIRKRDELNQQEVKE